MPECCPGHMTLRSDPGQAGEVARSAPRGEAERRDGDRSGSARMAGLAGLVARYRWLVIGLWALLAVAGAFAAPRAASALTYDFSLPGRLGDEADARIAELFGTGGENAPV